MALETLSDAFYQIIGDVEVGDTITPTEPPSNGAEAPLVWAGFASAYGDIGWKEGLEQFERLRAERYMENGNGYFSPAKQDLIAFNDGREADPWDEASASFIIAINDTDAWSVLAGFRIIDPDYARERVDYDEVAVHYPELGHPDDILRGTPMMSALNSVVDLQGPYVENYGLGESDIAALHNMPEISRFVSAGADAARYKISEPLAGAIGGAFGRYQGQGAALTDKGIRAYGMRVGMPVTPWTPEMFVPMFNSNNFIMVMDYPNGGKRRAAETHHFANLALNDHMHEFADAIEQRIATGEVAHG